jgi:DNA-binding transcriptional MocR family regulator
MPESLTIAHVTRTVSDVGVRSPTPAYQQLAAILRAQIKTGELAADMPLPSETALVQEFGVARGTVRRTPLAGRQDRLRQSDLPALTLSAPRTFRRARASAPRDPAGAV